MTDWDGRSVLPTSKKAKGILAYVVMQRGEAVARDRLIDLFWSDKTPERRKNSLRKALFDIRKVLGEASENVIDFSRGQVSVRTAALDCDLWGEDGSLNIRDLDTLCLGLDPVAEVFDEWLEAERRAVRTAQVRELEALLDAGDADPGELIRHAEALLKTEPDNETAARAAMRGHAALGNLGHTRQVFRDISGSLARDDLTVSAQTAALFEKLTQPSPAAVVARAHTGPPMVGAVEFTTLGELDPQLGQFLNTAMQARLGDVREFRVRIITAADREAVLSRKGVAGDLTYILTGSVGVSEDRFICKTSIARAGDNSHVGATNVTVDASDKVQAVDGIVDETVARLLPAIETNQAQKVPNDEASRSWYQNYIHAKTILNTAASPDYAEKAERLLRRVVEGNPEFLPAYPLLVSILNSRRRSTQPGRDLETDRNEALRIAQRALLHDVRYPSALIAKVWVLIRLKDFEQAERVLAEAVAARPYEASRVNSIGSAYIVLGDHDRAEAFLVRASRLMFHDLNYQNTDMGELNYFRGDYEKALSYLNVGETRNPTYARCLRAATLAQLGELAEARQEASEVVALFERNWNADEPFTEEAATRWFIDDFPMRREIDTNNLIDGLLKAGFKL